MRVGVIDAGIAIAWIRGALRDRKALDRLYTACRDGSVSLVMSTVNLAEVLDPHRQIRARRRRGSGDPF
jgi:hypothetical protein